MGSILSLAIREASTGEHHGAHQVLGALLAFFIGLVRLLPKVAASLLQKLEHILPGAWKALLAWLRHANSDHAKAEAAEEEEAPSNVHSTAQDWLSLSSFTSDEGPYLVLPGSPQLDKQHWFSSWRSASSTPASVSIVQEALLSPSARGFVPALRIAAGRNAGTQLRGCNSPWQYARPILEQKRTAILDLLQPLAANPSTFPANTRWLDLYAGTGCMGLEALSRGARSVHFVEDDQHVTRDVLSANIDACGARTSSVVHSYRVEQYLCRSHCVPMAFDVICLAPPDHIPTDKLAYALQDSPLVHKDSLVMIEYACPKHPNLPIRLGPLTKVRHCRLGHSWVVVYADAGPDGVNIEPDCEFMGYEDDDECF